MSPHRRHQRSLHGFTLVEVLVALGIVAIALVAGTQASSALLRNAGRQSDVLLGQICAENELSKARLARQLPSVGDSTVPVSRPGRPSTWRCRCAPPPTRSSAASTPRCCALAARC